MPDTQLRVLLDEASILQRIRQMGLQIGADYPHGNLRLICILKGACFFLADLARAIPRDVGLDFMGIASYGKNQTSSGQVRVTKDLDAPIEGADVLIVEDIVDTGVTLQYLTNLLEQRNPRSLRIAALLDKPERRLRPIGAAYVGFEIPDQFVVGYGLDFDERYRNLRDICVVSA